jgi:hypothetical protein
MTTKTDSKDLEPTVRLPRIPADLEHADPERTLVRDDDAEATMIREALPTSARQTKGGR